MGVELLAIFALLSLAAELAGRGLPDDDPFAEDSDMSVPHMPRGVVPDHADTDLAGFIFPVPSWIMRTGERRAAVVTSGYLAPGSKRQHHGFDIMFKRRAGEPFDGIHGSKGAYMPDGLFALAAGPGKVWSAGETHTPEGGSRGMGVIIDHGELVPGSGRAYSTFYNHGRAGTLLVKRGQKVMAGDRLFEIHGAPHQGAHALKHLHFEARLGLTRFDATALLAGWRRVDQAGP